MLDALPEATTPPKAARGCMANPTPLCERRAAKARDALATHFAAIDPDRTLTPAELLARFGTVVRAAGSETALAAALGVSNQLINHIRNDRQDIGRKLAAALGYEMRAIYVPMRRGGDAG